MSRGLGDGVADASLEPAQHTLVSCSFAAEGQHQGEVVLGSTKADSEAVGPHARGMGAGSTRFHLRLVFGRVSGLSFHHLFPLDPAH